MLVQFAQYALVDCQKKNPQNPIFRLKSRSEEFEEVTAKSFLMAFVLIPYINASIVSFSISYFICNMIKNKITANMQKNGRNKGYVLPTTGLLTTEICDRDASTTETVSRIKWTRHVVPGWRSLSSKDV